MAGGMSPQPFFGDTRMTGIRRALVLVGVLSAGSAAAALSPGDQYNLDQLLHGGPASIRSAAQNIANSGGAPELLDVLAEVVLQNAADGSKTGIDAVAWGCKALAARGGKRYYGVVKSVADNEQAHRKTRKHCERAAGDIGGSDANAYVPGSVSLEKLRASKPGAAPASASAAASAQPAASGQFRPITEVRVGMSMQEAYAIAGPPTSTSGHQTGKAWVPFNFKGGDIYRTIGHYKGQGRIVFSNTSAYSSGQRVHEVQVNPNEPGYP